jgi:hypothetical protein
VAPRDGQVDERPLSWRRQSCWSRGCSLRPDPPGSFAEATCSVGFGYSGYRRRATPRRSWRSLVALAIERSPVR